MRAEAPATREGRWNRRGPDIINGSAEPGGNAAAQMYLVYDEQGLMNATEPRPDQSCSPDFRALPCASCRRWGINTSHKAKNLYED
jgi:hypothetical protein